MWTQFTSRFDSATVSIGLALIFTIASQIFFTQESELWSECVCWILLPIAFVVHRQWTTSSSSKRSHSSSTPQAMPWISLWVMPMSLGVSSFYKTEYSLIALYPILTPLLLAAQTFLQSEMSLSASYKPQSTSLMWLTISSSVLGIVAVPADDIARSAISFVAVVAQWLLYATLSASSIRRWQFFPRIPDFEDAIVPLAKRNLLVLVAVSGLHTILFGFSANGIASTLFMGILKALSWFFIAQSAELTSWIIAPIIHTVALLSVLDPFWQTSLIRASLPVVAGILALAQVSHVVSIQAKSRVNLWIFSLVFLIPYLIHLQATRNAAFDAQMTYSNFTNHPVESLTRRENTQFERMLQKQSRSYDAVEQEYQRRYTYNPPRGLEAWFDFAASQGSAIIDDFDTIYHSVSPFWRLSGRQVTKMLETAYAEPESELWLCEFDSKRGSTRCRHAWRTFDRHITLMFDRLLGDLKGVIPDVKFLVNHLDEPRVLLPPSPGEDGAGLFNFTKTSHRPTWDMLTASCVNGSYNVDTGSNNLGDTFGLPFVTSQSLSSDPCHHSEYSKTHGLFQSPTSFHLFAGFVPVLSTGAPSVMGDVLFPSPAYIEQEFQYDEGKDVQWEDKRNDVYWMGSTTGGFAADNGWRNFHRQRFVTLAQGLERKQHTYLRKKDGMIRHVETSFLNRRLFDVAFTRIFQCEKKYCRDQKAFFRTKSWTNKNRALQSRFVFDLDGNGISGRYYQQLASRSVPLKQTLLREWHDDRLAPWVHYIPVSQSMEELPELVSYLTSSKSGQKRSHEIAQQGREWFSKAFRDVDMTIYLYRLILELARLQDLEREAVTKYT